MISTLRIFQIVACLAGFILAGCGLLPRTPEQPRQKLNPELIEKVALYKSLQVAALDHFGFSKPKCDATLFTALCKTAGGCQETDLFLAESKQTSGQWFRHALHDCYPAESGSDISRDMLLGVMTYLHATKDISKLSALQAYGRANDWIMGRGEISRTYFTPLMQSNLSKAIASIGGVTTVPQPDQPVDWPVNSGYQAHLDVLGILLRGTSDKSITTLELAYLDEQAKREPRNALFQAVLHRFKDGDQSAAEAVLLDATLFPKDALPTTANYCTHYLFQRDSKKDGKPSSDWLPCAEEIDSHDGIDFLFAAWVAGY